MRSQRKNSLIGPWPIAVAVVALLGYLWYGTGGGARTSYGHARHTECGIPIEPSVGIVDPGFGFERSEVEAALSAAIALWQHHSERALFVADEPRRRMPIDLVFDERQVLSNTMRQRQRTLERQERALQDVQERHVRLQQQLESDGDAYRRAEQQLHERTVEHDLRVREWNAGRGDRSPAAESRLRAAEAALQSERERLEDERARLNARVAATNQMAADVRNELDDFNHRVASFNQAAGGSPITAGGYTYARNEGRRITIYRANDYNELVLVLAHELGHSLGIGHVAEHDAVMHEEISAIPLPVRSLAAADAAALLAVCGR